MQRINVAPGIAAVPWLGGRVIIAPIGPGLYVLAKLQVGQCARARPVVWLTIRIVRVVRVAANSVRDVGSRCLVPKADCVTRLGELRHVGEAAARRPNGGARPHLL